MNRILNSMILAIFVSVKVLPVFHVAIGIGRTLWSVPLIDIFVVDIGIDNNLLLSIVGIIITSAS